MYFLIFASICFLFLLKRVNDYLNARKDALELAKKFDPSPPRTILGFTKIYEENLLYFMLKGFHVDVYKLFHTIMSFPQIYGQNFVIWGILNHLEIVVTRAEDLETILTSKTATIKADFYEFVRPWLGEGLLTSNGSKWFSRRKIITPTFHFKILEQYLEIFNEQNTKLVRKLKNYVKSHEECNIYEYLTAAGLDNICETAMGVKINAQDNPNSEYTLAVKEMGDIVTRRFLSLLNQFPRLWALTPAAKRARELYKILHGFTDKVINERRHQLKFESNQKQSTKDQELIGKKERHSFLDMLLQATIDGKPLSDLDIREEVDTFMFEGHDTTTSGMTFTIYNLAMHPEVQNRVFEEIRQIMGDDPSTLCSYNDLQEMKYLDKVIKETLRLHPAVSLIARKTIEPIEIQGTTVPAGINVNIPIYAINRNPKVFSDPEKFDPERFEGEKERSWGPFDYIPFSAGHRNCIGQKFAMLELKAVISTIVRHFRIKAVQKTINMTYQSDFVLRPQGGLFVRLEERK